MDKDRIVVITGASRGIGKAIALQFAGEDCRLAISCHNNSRQLKEVCKQVEEAGSDCLCYTGDMGDDTEVKNFFEQIENAFGCPDILINNAGISYLGLLQDMSSAEWEKIIRTNLSSVFYCCKHTIPGMLQKKQGKIINISSVWGQTGASMEVAYSTTKGGINAFTKALAKELAPSNIQVNAIACGIINTDMNHFLTPDELASLKEEIPAGRLGQPEEVAQLVSQLVRGNQYLTGQIITLDGGWI